MQPIRGARVLALLGDSVTTDHISPAGEIAANSPAGRYLIERGVPQSDYNSYGARRGNDRVMARGTFANHPAQEPAGARRRRRRDTVFCRSVQEGIGDQGEMMPIYDAAQRYKSEGTPLIIIAGKEYGTGSSRDWAAKGVALLGVKAVLAESFERIHRSNLVGMGMLPLQFKPGENVRIAGSDRPRGL